MVAKCFLGDGHRLLNVRNLLYFLLHLNKILIHIRFIVLKARNAINPFLTESVFDTFTSASFESNIDVLFSSSHNVSTI